VTSSDRYQFGSFTLDTVDRQLWKGTERVDVSARYLDALTLLVDRSPQLVEKDHFFDIVWQDVVVSDNALSQCIKELRHLLDDDAGNPRFIQTVPRHGYRFIASVTRNADIAIANSPTEDFPKLDSGIRSRIGTLLAWWGAWSAGGALAGLMGGLLYGFGLSSPGAGIGTLSTLLVLIALNVLVGTAGGAGMGAGFTAGWMISQRSGQSRALWLVMGCVLSSMFFGASAKMLGLDAFNLLFGHAPEDMTGGMEGAALGAAIAGGMLLGERLLQGPRTSVRMAGSLGAGIMSGLTGVFISLAGGHLMGGSLRSLADSFSDSRLEMGALVLMFGQLDDGQWAEAALAGMEGLIFGACLVGTWGWIRRIVGNP
jgi:DNA-binding winged helix-turn-helix (wHTH) protein